MRLPHLRPLIALTVACCCVALAAEDGVIHRWGFEDGVDGWITGDSQARLGRSNAPDLRFRDAWVAEFSFMQRLPDAGNEEEVPGMVAASVPGSVSELQSVRFAVATAFPTPVIVALNEEDGSSYQAVVWSPAGSWTEACLALEDFTRDLDTPDENAKLDCDQIRMLAFLDGGLVGRSLESMGIPIFNHKPAENTLWLDEVTLSSEPAAARQEGGLVVDACDAPTIQWMPLGAEDVTMDLVEATGDEAAHYKIDYVVPGQKAFGLARRIPAGVLEGCSSLSFDLRCEMATTLFLFVEDTNHERYGTAMQVGAGPRWETREIRFSSLGREGGQGGAGVVLKPEQISQLFLGDISAIESGTISANLWCLRNLRGVK